MNIAQKRLERQATRLIAAHDNTPRKDRIRYRGTRPAWNWLARQDKRAAASLWLLARQMLPQAANDNNEPDLINLDRRRDGKARGPAVPGFDVAFYLAIQGARPRFGDPAAEEQELCGWHTDGYAIERQRQPHDFPFYPFGRFTRCRPGLAWESTR